MKAKFYISLGLGFTLASTSVLAQTSLGQKKTTPVSTVVSNEGPINTGLQQDLDRSSLPTSMNMDVPRYAQIHTPIRWYALENADNEVYWNAVNTDKLWIEFEQGVSLNNPEIDAFINQFGLGIILRESPFKEKTNYITVLNPFDTREELLMMIEASQEIEGIKFIEPTQIHKKMLTPNDPLWEQQWGPYVTYFDEAWNSGIGGNSLNMVAVIDDACDWNHEDLYDQVWYGYDYANDDFDISPDAPTDDHGTHVTGTVAATINNGIGVAGMVNDTVFFAKTSDGTGGLSIEAIINALYDIADVDRITAVNMSLGSDSPSAAEEQACNNAWNNGKLLLVSSGNNGQGFISFPAAYEASMAVGAIGADGNNLYLTSYSQYGNEQEITAPGGDEQAGFSIVSTLPGNNYGVKDGTSMAAPHVTGLAGLMKNLNPNLTNADIRNIINATAFDYGDAGWDPIYGFGMINALGAVDAAQGGSVGVQDRSGDEFFKLYPNPASDRILLSKEQGLTKGTIEIMDITGKVVMNLPLQGGATMSIDLSELNSGVYILRMASDGVFASSRFIKS